jgi:MFS family permease
MTAVANRNLIIYLGGQGLSNVGTFSQQIALALLVLDVTGSGLALGAAVSTQAVPYLVLSPWAGPLLDRVPLRRLMPAVAVVGALQAVLLAALAVTDSITLPWVIGLAFVLGCVQVFERPAVLAFLGELVPPESIPKAVSLASSVQAFGRLGGPALAALLYAWHGPGLVFVVNAVSYLLVVVALYLLRTDALYPRERRRGQQGRLIVAIRYAWNAPALWPLLLGNAIVGLFAFNFGNFFATMSTLTFQQPSLYGIGASLNGTAAVLAGLVLARYLRTPTGRTVGISCMALGGVLTWIALAPTPLLYLVGMPFFGFAVVAYGAMAQSLVQQLSPREMVGRMMSLYTLGSMGTTPLGALIVGLASDYASPRVAVGLGAVSAVLVGLLLVMRWHLDRAPDARPGH